MKRYIASVLIGGIFASLSYASESPLDDKIAEWNNVNQAWNRKYNETSDGEQRLKLLETRPNPANYVLDIWRMVGNKLNNEASLPGIIWLIQNNQFIAQAYMNRGEQSVEKATVTAKKIFLACLNALEERYLLYPSVGQVSGVLSQSTDPRMRGILNKIRTANSNSEDQGLAALGLSISYGMEEGLHQDDQRILKMRAQLLKEAILKAYDTKLAGVSTNGVMEESLYEINKLTRGKDAPSVELISTATNTPVHLPLKDKMTLLVFWEPHNVESLKFLASLESLKETHPDIVILPIASSKEDAVKGIMENIQSSFPCLLDSKMDANRAYMVKQMPYIYLIGSDGKILTRGFPGSFFDSSLGAVLNTVDAKTKADLAKKSDSKTKIEPKVPANNIEQKIGNTGVANQAVQVQKPSSKPANTKQEKLPEVNQAPQLQELPDEFQAPPLRDFEE